MARTLHRRSSTAKLATGPAGNLAENPARDFSDDTAGDYTTRPPQHERSFPAGRRNAPSSTGTGNSDGGWNAFRTKVKSNKFAENFKIGDEEIVVKFLQAGPYAVFQQHWLKEAEGRKSFVCLGEDCPLCDDLADEPRYQILFNIVDFSNPDKPELKTWATGVRLAQKLEGLSENPKTGPLDRADIYYIVSKSGKGTKTEYNLRIVRKSNLLDEENIEPLDDEELAEFTGRCHGPESVRQDSREDLEDLVRELS